MKLRASSLLILLFAATVTSASERHTVNVNGVAREYLLHVPPGLGEKPVPLFIVLHGGGGEGSSMERYARFDPLADREHFVVAYPDGLDRGWNDGRGEIKHAADDVGFISAMIDDIAHNSKIDLKRVYATGMSNGGMMSNRLACELSPRLAAVALVASSGGAAAMKTCRPAQPVGYLVIDGTADPIVPYAGGTVRIMRGPSRGEVIGAEATIQFWVKANGCGKELARRDLPNRANDGTSASVMDYAGCKMPTKLYKIEGGGHTWPSSHPYLPKAIVGATSHQIDATEVIWEFFRGIHR